MDININYDYSDMYDTPEYIPSEGDTMTDDEGNWFFEDGEWWSE